MTVTTIYTDTTLKLKIDQTTTTLDLVKSDGGHVNVWGQTLVYAFAPQQLLLTLHFTPINGSDVVTAWYVNGGTTVHSSPLGGSAVITIQRPPNPGVSFEIRLEQGSESAASVRSALLASDAKASDCADREDPASMHATNPYQGPTVPTARRPGLDSSPPLPMPSGPGARLQTRLVLTTVASPPDPDGRFGDSKQ